MESVPPPLRASISRLSLGSVNCRALKLENHIKLESQTLVYGFGCR
jgi:hypothetical protein